MKLSDEQLEKLSELFLDIAKGSFLAALAVPVVASNATVFDSLRAILVGLTFTYLTLKTVERKEVEK